MRSFYFKTMLDDFTARTVLLISCASKYSGKMRNPSTYNSCMWLTNIFTRKRFILIMCYSR